MTEGSITKKLVAFAAPLFLGQLMQQLYNVIDSVVVGNVLGRESLAAITSTGSLIFLLVGFINGMFVGNNVIVGKRYGAKDYNGLSVAVHTGIAFSFEMGIVLTAVGILFTPHILRLMGTPEDVLPKSVLSSVRILSTDNS